MRTVYRVFGRLGEREAAFPEQRRGGLGQLQAAFG
jgi:hypothetical protein